MVGFFHFIVIYTPTPGFTLSDIKVTEVPDNYVYLTKNADWMHSVELGMLKRFSGTVSFDLPMGVNPEDHDSMALMLKIQR